MPQKIDAPKDPSDRRLLVTSFTMTASKSYASLFSTSLISWGYRSLLCYRLNEDTSLSVFGSQK